jgi:hypothetical protein
VSENDLGYCHENRGFRADRIPPLPGSVKSRQRLGEDLQPVGDYAGIEPYFRVCADVGEVQHQDRSKPEAFTSDDAWWWNHRRIRFLNGKAFIGLSALLLVIPYVWGMFLVAGGGIVTVYYLIVLTAHTLHALQFIVILFAMVIWVPLSFIILIKTLPWVMGGFALLLRPFDALLARLLDRGLDAGESYFSRETGEVSFALPGGRKLTAPFEEFDAYVERVIQHGGIFYRLMFVHRYTGKQFSQTSLSRVEPSREEVMALWDMLQRYMDVSQPLPDVPRLEPFRHLDPVTVAHDQATGRPARYWRDLDLEAWQRGEGAEWLRRQTAYAWDTRVCRLTPRLGLVSLADYRELRPEDAYPV